MSLNEGVQHGDEGSKIGPSLDTIGAPDEVGTGISIRPAGTLSGVLRRSVYRLDHVLRQRYRIWEFSSHPECLLRIAFVRADRPVRLSDDVEIEPGDRILDLHLWNEHLPQIPTGRSDMVWARVTARCMRLSLRELAGYIEAQPRLAEVNALRGQVTFFFRNGRAQLDRLAAHYGFDVVATDACPTLRQQLHDLGNDILVWMLVWAFNPGAMRHTQPIRPRCQLWMSRQRLVERYGQELDRASAANAIERASRPRFAAAFQMPPHSLYFRASGQPDYGDKRRS